MQDETTISRLGDRLRLYLKVNRLTAKQFSKYSGVPYRTLQDYLGKKRLPGAEHLARIAATGVDIKWLLTDQIDSGLLLEFEGFEPLSGVLAADNSLARGFMKEADDIVYEWNLDRISKGEKLLYPSGTILSLWSVFISISRVIDGSSDRILVLKEQGWTDQEIIDFVMEGLRPLLLDRLKVLEPISAEFRDPPASTP